ncbi:unnamed protein product, partial [Leptidea sinapis]
TLSVNGDPDEVRGDISLSLQERGAAVGVVAGSKNLTLVRALDREERLGPSSVYVNVRCDRRHSSDPARVSELTAVGARVVTAAARDPDQPGPHATVHYSVLPGPGAEYVEFANELDGTLVVKKPLDYESVRELTVRLRAADGGSPPRVSDTTLRLLVLDADDQNPRFSHEHYVAELLDHVLPGMELETSPGPISAADQDLGINAPLQYSVSAEGTAASAVRVQRDTGRLSVTDQLLRENLPLTVVVKATQVDNPDRYALATVSIRRRTPRGAPASVSVLPSSPEPPPAAAPPPASSKAPVQSGVAPVQSGVAPVQSGVAPVQPGVHFSKREYVAHVAEDAAPGALLVTLHTLPPRMTNDGALQFFVSERGFLERFAINSAGDVLLRAALDYETQRSYHYRNDTASLNISVIDVNEWEPRFRYPQYEFRADMLAGGGAGGGGLVRVGQLDVHDGDEGDDVTLSLKGLHAPLFYVNKAGELFLRSEAMRAVNSSVLHVVATAIDSGSPPRQTSVPVAVHVSGTGDEGGTRVRSASVLVTFVVALVVLAAAVLALLTYIYT